MTEQPEALRLADELETAGVNAEADGTLWAKISPADLDKAAAELRRLHDLLGKANALARIRANRHISYVCPVCAASMLEGDTALLRQALKALNSDHSLSAMAMQQRMDTIAALRERLGENK